LKRGDLYRVYKSAPADPKRSRVFVLVSRQVLIDSKYSTVICAPVYSSYEGLSTQVPVGIEEGLKHDSAIHCDGLISIPKKSLTNYLGTLADEKLSHVNRALFSALELE
jgi:mRNA interferase MazF